MTRPRSGDPRRATITYKRLRERQRALRLPCWLCGKPVIYDAPPRSRWSFSVDHVVPLKYGGSCNDPGNLAQRITDATAGEAHHNHPARHSDEHSPATGSHHHPNEHHPPGKTGQRGAVTPHGEVLPPPGEQKSSLGSRKPVDGHRGLLAGWSDWSPSGDFAYFSRGKKAVHRGVAVERAWGVTHPFHVCVPRRLVAG